MGYVEARSNTLKSPDGSLDHHNVTLPHLRLRIRTNFDTSTNSSWPTILPDNGKSYWFDPRYVSLSMKRVRAYKVSTYPSTGCWPWAGSFARCKESIPLLIKDNRCADDGGDPDAESAFLCPDYYSSEPIEPIQVQGEFGDDFYSYTELAVEPCRRGPPECAPLGAVEQAFTGEGTFLSLQIETNEEDYTPRLRHNEPVSAVGRWTHVMYITLDPVAWQGVESFFQDSTLETVDIWGARHGAVRQWSGLQDKEIRRAPYDPEESVKFYLRRHRHRVVREEAALGLETFVTSLGSAWAFFGLLFGLLGLVINRTIERGRPLSEIEEDGHLTILKGSAANTRSSSTVGEEQSAGGGALPPRPPPTAPGPGAGVGAGPRFAKVPATRGAATVAATVAAVRPACSWANVADSRMRRADHHLEV
jgi:hypothetical protein